MNVQQNNTSPDIIQADLSLKRLCILGGGESGIGAALLAKQNNYIVFLSDGNKIKEKFKKELIENGIEFEEEGHTEEKILNADIIVKSPGIPEKSELIKKIRERNIMLISEIEWEHEKHISGAQKLK